MAYLPLPDRTAYSIRANPIIVEILITAKIQTGHRTPQMGKTLKFEQACGLANFAPRHLAVGAIKCIGIAQRIVVSCGLVACRSTVYEIIGKYWLKNVYGKPSTSKRWTRQEKETMSVPSEADVDNPPEAERGKAEVWRYDSRTNS